MNKTAKAPCSLIRHLHVLNNVVFLDLLSSKVATCRDRPLQDSFLSRNHSATQLFLTTIATRKHTDLAYGSYARILLSESGPIFAPRKGIAALEQAAHDKHAHAALLLGEYFSTGKYVTTDLDLARRYLERARDSGLKEAEKKLAKFK